MAVRLKDIPSFTNQRLAKRFTIIQLAKTTGVKKTTLFKLEAGKSIYPHEAKKIAKALEIRIIDMFVLANGGMEIGESIT